MKSSSFFQIIIVAMAGIGGVVSDVRSSEDDINTIDAPLHQIISENNEPTLQSVEATPSYSHLRDSFTTNASASSTISSPPQTQQRRHLAIGDFAELNKLFQGAVIALPDTTISERVVGITLTLDLTNLRCQDISVGDIVITFDSNNAQSRNNLLYQIDVISLNLSCLLDHRYRYAFVRGDGSATATASNNAASVGLRFTTPTNFRSSPPTSVTIDSCAATVNIVDLDFSGGIVNSILNTFERLIRGSVESAVRTAVCDELRSLGDSFAADALGLVQEFLDPLLNYDEDSTLPAVALRPELSLGEDDDVNLVNFQGLDDTIGSWFRSALNEADALLGMEMNDPDSPFGITRDLGVNVLLRDFILDEERALVVDMGRFELDQVDLTATDFATLLYEGHDQLTETTILLQRVKVFGLDTMTQFDPLNFVGNQTVTNELKWEFLTIEMDLIIEIKPSTLEDSLIVEPGAEKVVEYTQIKFGVDNVDAIVSLFLAIDQDKLGQLNLGSLLSTDNLLPCLLSSLYDVQLSEITASVGNIRDPVLEGFVSPGIDRVVTRTVEALFLMYEATVLRALPAFFQIEMREFVNNDLIAVYMDRPGSSDCPPSNFTASPDSSGAIDFRDLLLRPEESLAMAGTGEEPYGDIGYTVLNLVEEQLFAVDEDTGLPRINRLVLASLTEDQSGIAGTISQEDNLFEFVRTQVSSKVEYFVDYFRLAAYNLRIENIDTLTAPLTLLQPTNKPHTLSNLINFGPVENRALTMKIRVMMELEGNSPLDMKNEFDLIVSVPNSLLSADFFAKVDADSFAKFPLEDIANPSCWLDKIQRNGTIPEISIPNFALNFSGFGIGADCIDCASKGVSVLPELTTLLGQTGGIRTLSERIEMLADEVVMSGYIQDVLNRLVEDSGTSCPHSQGYIPGSNGTTFADIGFPALSTDAVDTVIFAVALAGEIGLIVFAEDHIRSETSLTDPLSAQIELGGADDKRLLDFNDLSDSIGSILDAGINDLRSYLSDEVDDLKRQQKDLGINLVIRDYLLQDGEKYSFDFDDDSFRVGNVFVNLNSLKVVGLDTLTSVDIIEPIAPQTIMNRLAWEKLSLELHLDIAVYESSTSDIPLVGPETLVLSLGVEDLTVDVGLFAAMDIDKLGGIEIGSLLTSDRIFGCMMRMIDKVELTQMASTVGRVTIPTLEGFMGEELRNTLLESVEIAFEKYQEDLVEGFPLMIDETLRPLLNGALVAYTERPNVQCLSNERFEAESVVDFRDLFLSKDSALAAGARGGSPYGDVASFLKTFVRNELLQVDPNTGEPPINDLIVRPLTNDQSGVEGDLLFPGSIVSVETDSAERFGVNTITLQISDARLYNLDTLGEPFELLEPNATNGNLLDNTAMIGAGNESFGGEIKFLLELSGDPQLEMRNELNLGVDIQQAFLASGIVARLSERGLMKFPIRDVFDMNCWLSALVFIDLDSDGMKLPGETSSLSFESLRSVVENLAFNISCSNCTSPGLSSLSDVTDILERTGVTDTFETRIVDFTTELMLSDFIQITLDQLVHGAAMNCPHSVRYIENYTAPEYDGPRFPSLSRDSIETVVFTGAIAVNVATVLVGLSHSNTEVAEPNPLYLQENIHSVLEGSPALRLLDFTNLERDIGAWASTGLDEARTYLGSQADDVGGPSGDTDLGVNVLMRSLFLDDRKALSVTLDSISLSQNGMEISLDEVRIYGLDSFITFSALDAIGRQTLQNKFEWSRLILELDITIVGNDSASQRKLSRGEKLTVSFGVNDVKSSLSLFMAIDQNALTSMTVGSFLEIDQIFPCLLSTAAQVSVTELGVEVGEIEKLELEGFLSPELDGIVHETTDVLMDEYGDMVVAAIPAVFDKSIRAIANNWISYYLGLESSTACPEFSQLEGLGDSFIDFRDLLLPVDMSRMLGGSGDSRYGDLFREVLEFINDRVLEIDEESGVSAVNGLLIAPLTEAQSDVPGTLVYPRNLLDTGNRRIDIEGFQANVELKAYNARVENLDTIGAPVSILDPMEDRPHNLNNTASFGVGQRPLRFAVDLLIMLLGDEDLQLRNEVEISVDLESTTVVLEALLKITETSFLDFPIRDLSNLDCWLATLPSPQLDSRGVRLPDSSPTAMLKKLLITLSHLRLNVTCISCSSPRMTELSDLLSTPEAQESTTRVGNNILAYATELLEGEFLQLQIDRRLNEAPKRCPHHPDYDPRFDRATYDAFVTPDRKDDTVTFLITLMLVTVTLILAVVLIIVVVKFIVGRRNRAWLRKLPEQKLLVVHKIQSEERAKEAAMNRMSKSMFCSPEVPLLVRLLMPIIIIGNVAFFLSGHLSLGATVNVEAQLAGEKIVLENFFEFSVAQSTIDIWRAGGKELAIFILIFSGVWPYTKQLITLVLWFSPPSVVSISRRGSFFLWLDALAKWSMADIFVLLTSLVAFRISIKSPTVDFLPVDFYSVDLLVVPLWGLYANMIAQLISQVSSHFIIHYHRRIEEAASQEYDRQNEAPMEAVEDGSTNAANSRLGTKESLKDHAFARPHRGESDKLVVRRGIGSLMALGTAVLSILIVVGCVLPSFSIEALGMVGIFIESGQNFRQSLANHSVFTIVELLFEEASFLGTTADYIGLGTLSAILILTVLVVPILQSLALLYQWFVPLDAQQRNRLAVTIEMLQGWQYVEVYLLAVIISSWQLGPTSEFMINAFCTGLEDTFASLVYYGILDPDDAQCFQVRAGVENATYILMSCATILAVMNTFVQKAVRQYDRDHSRIVTLLHDSAKLESELMTLEKLSTNAAEEMRKEVEPCPVLFTDTFRWCLRREDAEVSSEALKGLDEDAKLGGKCGFMEAVVEQDPSIALKNVDHMVDVDLDPECLEDSHHIDEECSSRNSVSDSEFVDSIGEENVKVLD